MQLNGHINKMQASLEEGVAHYKLSFDDQQVDMNSLLWGNILSLHLTKQYNAPIQNVNALLLKVIHRATVSLVHALWPGVTYAL